MTPSGVVAVGSVIGATHNQGRRGTMQVHNMLERQGHGYKVGNIKLIKVRPEYIDVYTRAGETIIYKRVRR